MLAEQPKKLGLASMYADAALRDDDKLAPAHLLRGVLAARHDEWSLALHHLERAVSLAPQLRAARDALGIVQVHVGQLEAARKTFAQLTAPSYEAPVARGAAERAAGDLAAAKATYEQASALDASRAEARDGLRQLDKAQAP